MFILSYVYDFAYQQMVQDDVLKYTDFFECIEISVISKLRISKQYPELYGFLMRAYFQPDDKVVEKINCLINEKIKDVYTEMMKRIDYSKFRNGIDLEKSINIIYWTGEGLLKKKLETTEIQELDMDKVSAEFGAYMDIFKKAFYKEEFQ